jgi:hypothetical protein
MLWPLVRSDLPSCLEGQVSPRTLSDWYAFMLVLKNDIWTWMVKHDKHIKV